MDCLRYILTVVLALAVAEAVGDDRVHHRVSVSGLLTSSDSYSIEAAYHYMVCEYVGVGGAFGGWANYWDDGFPEGHGWNIDPDDNKPSNFYLRPSVVVKTPSLKYRAASWSLIAEPGVMLNIPYQRVGIELTHEWPLKNYDYVSTCKGQWLAFDLRLGVNLEIESCGLSVGYMMSNLDIFSQYRHLSFRGESFSSFYSSKSFMQGAYLSLYYIF